MVGGEYTQRRNAERSLKLPLNALARPSRSSHFDPVCLALLLLFAPICHPSFLPPPVISGLNLGGNRVEKRRRAHRHKEGVWSVVLNQDCHIEPVTELPI